MLLCFLVAETVPLQVVHEHQLIAVLLYLLYLPAIVLHSLAVIVHGSPMSSHCLGIFATLLSVVAPDFEFDRTAVLGHIGKDLVNVGKVLSVVNEASEVVESEGNEEVEDQRAKEDESSQVFFFLKG